VARPSANQVPAQELVEPDDLQQPALRALTPEYVNAAPGRDLHRFKWIDDAAIGELPLEWNWLVGEYEYNPGAKIVHFTIGGPYFDEYRDCDYAVEWFAEFESCAA